MIVLLSIDTAKMKGKNVRPFMCINILVEKIMCAHVVVLLTINYMHT